MRSRPDDEVVLIPLADGGDGTMEAVAAEGDEWRTVEVADPRGRPRQARWLLRADGTAVIECAEACGLKLLAPEQLDPLRTTTYGVGQLLEDARLAGCRQIVLGLGGSATVDGGAGALTALGVAVLREDGSGVKVGGGELPAVARVEPRWADPAWEEVLLVLWCDVDTVLERAAATFGPQKGATPEAVERLHAGLMRWADVMEGGLDVTWRDHPGSGAAGGLGFGLAACLGAQFEPGAPAVARLAGLAHALEGADLVVTGEGELDVTSGEGKVVGHVLAAAHRAGVRTAAVVGRVGSPVVELELLEEASPDGIPDDPGGAVAAAAARLARSFG